MKILGIGTIVVGILMLLAGMSGDLTLQTSHDTILMITGPVFGLIGIGLTAYGLVKPGSKPRADGE